MKKETEIRGKFESKKELKNFLKRVDKDQSQVIKRRRLSVIFTDLNHRGIDIQVRILNRQGQLVVKIGQLANSVRNEVTTYFEYTSFLPLISQLNILGINNGVVAQAIDWVYDLGDIELKVTLCDEKIFVWEIESLKKGVGDKELTRYASELGLKVMSVSELEAYWEWMKKYANSPFSQSTIMSVYETFISNSS